MHATRYPIVYVGSCKEKKIPSCNPLGLFILTPLLETSIHAAQDSALIGSKVDNAIGYGYVYAAWLRTARQSKNNEYEELKKGVCMYVCLWGGGPRGSKHRKDQTATKPLARGKH